MALIARHARPRVTELSNGLKVATLPVASEFSTFGVWVPSGSIFETPRTNGTAHFLEHLLLRSNAVYSSDQLSTIADQTGISMVASTARSHTAFSADAESKNAALAIDLVATSVFRPAITDTRVEAERWNILA
jgi:processing peptidase subunit beta